MFRKTPGVRDDIDFEKKESKMPDAGTCVADACCHASGCVLAGSVNSPNCEDVMCTMVCAPGTMDCGAGACKFRPGFSNASSCCVVWRNGSNSCETSSSLSTFVDEPFSWIIAFVFAAIGFSIATWNVIQHLRHFNSPEKQKPIVRIISIVPFYAIFSWLSLVFIEKGIYFDTVRDVYEAYVIYAFLNLVLGYGGGEASTCSIIAQSPGSIQHPWPLKCVMKPIALGGTFLHTCKRATVQFVLMKPVAAIVSLSLYAADLYDSPAYQWILLIVYNVSYTLALYWLFLFYLATKEMLRARKAHPVFKFLAVKLVVFATYYQQLAVAAVKLVPEEERARWNSFVLCVEMSLFAILHVKAFSYLEFMGIDDFEIGVLSNDENENVDPASAAPKESSSQGKEKKMFQNLTQILSVRDVSADVYHSFTPKYDAYALAVASDSPASLRVDHAGRQASNDKIELSSDDEDGKLPDAAPQ